MNWRILLKSMRVALRAKKRVFAFMIIYAILFVVVGKQVERSAVTPGSEVMWLGMAGLVATVYAILISQFRRRDIAILKCISWQNNDILLLLVGEVVIVSLSAFLMVFQLSVEVLGLISYFSGFDLSLLTSVRDAITVDARSMAYTLFYIVVLQIPGLALAQYRAMRIPPMKALREE